MLSARESGKAEQQGLSDKAERLSGKMIFNLFEGGFTSGVLLCFHRFYHIIYNMTISYDSYNVTAEELSKFRRSLDSTMLGVQVGFPTYLNLNIRRCQKCCVCCVC